MPKTFQCLEALRALEPKFLNLIFMDFFKTLLPRVTVLRIVDSYLLEVCMCARVCVCMFLCAVCVCECVCVFVWMVLCVCVHVRLCICMCVCICVRTYCTDCMYSFLFILNIYSTRSIQLKLIVLISTVHYSSTKYTKTQYTNFYLMYVHRVIKFSYVTE